MVITSNLIFRNIFLSYFINKLRLFKRPHSGDNVAHSAPGPRLKDGFPNLEGAGALGAQGTERGHLLSNLGCAILRSC